MIDQQKAATIEQGYAHAPGEDVEPASTTLRQVLVPETVRVVNKPRPRQSVFVSPALSLRDYDRAVITGLGSALGAGGHATVTNVFILQDERSTIEPERASIVPSRRGKYAKLIALIESWLEDETDYDETAWPRLKARIEESRTSTRRRFSE